MSGSRIRAVVFDMGGVLVELGPLTDILGDEPLTSDEFWQRWLSSPTVRDFEMGRCSVEDFGDRLVLEMGLSFDGAEFIERFRRWPRGLYPGVLEMIAALPDGVTTAVLSNTNELHWAGQKDAEAVRALAEHPYLSYELGLAKPDRDIFDHIVADLGLPAAEILFIDDNQINVDGAAVVGMTAALAKGPDQLRVVLTDHGLL